MRIPKLVLSVISCLVLSTPAMGAQPTEINGQSNKFRVSFDDPREVTNPNIHFSRFDQNASATGEYSLESKPVPFKSECEVTKSQIVCHSKGRSPLAGATYQLTKDGTPTCPGANVDYRYTCIRGCKSGAPKFLSINVYEC